MKKITSLTLAALLALSMAACGSSKSEQETTLPPVDSTGESSTQAAEMSTEATNEETTAETTATVFEEIALVDNDSITFKITAVEEDPVWGYTLKVFLENKTDKELMFSLNDTAVNGFMCDPYWAESVAPGMKSNTSISWLESDFAENGIEAVEEITFTLRVYDSEDWLAEDVLNERYTVNP